MLCRATNHFLAQSLLNLLSKAKSNLSTPQVISSNSSLRMQSSEMNPESNVEKNEVATKLQVPFDFCCPLTGKVMLQPVILNDGKRARIRGTSKTFFCVQVKLMKKRRLWHDSPRGLLSVIVEFC